MSASRRFLQRVSLDEARRRLVDAVAATDAEDVAVDDAAGRIAAATVTAKRPSPHYRASAMDGLAVRASDTAAAPLRLAVADGRAPAPGRAACVPVDTGSLLPEWTDAVVRIENATADGDGYRVPEPVAPGRDVRREGEDIEAGAVLLRDGDRIRPWDVGAMLATGTTTVRVRRRPGIGILATGSEVVEPSDAAAPGQVLDYNSRVIAALAAEWGATPHRLGITADDPKRLEAAIADAASRFDAVCVIAGSSAGRRDFTIDCLAALGDVFVHGVDIAPGRPVALARLGGAATPVLAVPGYPVSAIVVCERLLGPLVSALLGTAEPRGVVVRARLARAIPSRLGMEEFRRVCLVRQRDGSLVVAPLPSGAGSISSVAEAHAWLRIPSHAEGCDAGSEVDVELAVPIEDVDAAFVLAGRRCEASAILEDERRRAGARGRVSHLRLATPDALAALRRGEAHAVLLHADEAAAAGPGLRLRKLEGSAMLVATAHDGD